MMEFRQPDNTVAGALHRSAWSPQIPLMGSQLKDRDCYINAASLKPPRTLFEQLEQQKRKEEKVWSRPTSRSDLTALDDPIRAKGLTYRPYGQWHDTTRRNAMCAYHPYGLIEINYIRRL